MPILPAFSGIAEGTFASVPLRENDRFFSFTRHDLLLRGTKTKKVQEIMTQAVPAF